VVGREARALAAGAALFPFLYLFLFAGAVAGAGKTIFSFGHTPFRFFLLFLSPPLQAGMALYSVLWVLVVASQTLSSGRPLSSLWPGYADPSNWGLVLYVALVAGALSSYLQTRGQGTVGAAQAQVIYSSTPLWTALFAALLLGGESLGTLGWAGGGLIVAAGLVAAWGESRRSGGGGKAKTH
jgi:drug/metabolite transporter (DMT)-like permease